MGIKFWAEEVSFLPKAQAYLSSFSMPSTFIDRSERFDNHVLKCCPHVGLS